MTPLSVGALTNERVFTDLFDLNDEREIGHIRLSREADLIVVAPATADLLAKMAGGHADDLATTVLLATDKPVLVAPAMNPRMWLNPATQRNVAQLEADGIHFVGPDAGEMAERGEAGPGRLAEVPEIIARHRSAARERRERRGAASPSAAARGPSRAGHQRPDARADRSGALHRQPLVGQAGPRHRRRGRGARRARDAGHRARWRCPILPASTVVHVETAAGDAATRCSAALPADVAVFAAAVADWRIGIARRATRSRRSRRRTADARPRREPRHPGDRRQVARRRGPALVIGFAAETDDVVEHAAQEAQGEGRRLDRRQRRVAGDRRHGRRRATACISSRPTASRTGRP